MFIEIPGGKLLRKIQNCNVVQLAILFKFSGFHSSVNGVSVLLWCDTVSLVIWFPIFRDSMVVSKCQNQIPCHAGTHSRRLDPPDNFLFYYTTHSRQRPNICYLLCNI